MALFIYPHVGMLSYSRLYTKHGLKYYVWLSQRLGKASLHQWKQDATLPPNIQSCTHQKAKLHMHRVSFLIFPCTRWPMQLCLPIFAWESLFVHLKIQTKPNHINGCMCTIRKAMFPSKSHFFAHLMCIVFCVIRAYCPPPLPLSSRINRVSCK